MPRRWFHVFVVGLLLLGAGLPVPTGAQAGDSGTITLTRRVAGYDLDSPRRLRGYFPEGAVLTITGEGPPGMVQVHFVSPRDQVVEAYSRRVDLDLPPAGLAAMRASVGTADSDDGEVWTETDRDNFCTRLMLDDVRQAIDLDGMSWRHAETDHYVLHYEHGIFARKVARMAEFFYDYISTDLAAPEDVIEGRSHILIFREEDTWQSWLSAGGGTEWAFAYVRGPSMFLQQARGDTAFSNHVLAHETTHLVLNRFFRAPIPLWLNEGMAEWYGEFAYAAFKGIKKSQGAVFRRLEADYPVMALLDATGYPTDQKARYAFYETAKLMVGFLRLDYPEDTFVAFIHDVMGGKDTDQALRDHYGFASRDELARAFDAFVN